MIYGKDTIIAHKKGPKKGRNEGCKKESPTKNFKEKTFFFLFFFQTFFFILPPPPKKF